MVSSMLSGWLLASVALPVTCGSKQKNVLFMLADDGGFEFSVWGNNVTHTPHLAQLASRGTTFDRAYTAVSSCSPSRSAILSGLPTHQNGMYGLHQPPGNFQSNSGVVGLPNLLNDAGYKTGIIGKYHVGPVNSYNFTYGLTAEHCWAGAIASGGNGATCPSLQVPNSRGLCQVGYNNVTRNLTNMKHFMREFLTEIEPQKPFFLYVGFGDTHRCGFESKQGSFCENYGSGKAGQGTIPDWTPRWFQPSEVVVPWFLPDNAAVREDLAAQYTAVNRMDQGIGLLMHELEAAGHANDTLVFYFADNGIPFPAGKTNLYEQGQGEPLVIMSPEAGATSVRSRAVVSSLDFAPTILSWAGIHSASPGVGTYQGSSLLPLLAQREPPQSWRNTAFASHSYHSLYAYYPMRSVVNDRFRLINNLLSDVSYPILEDVYDTRTWQDIRQQGSKGQSTGWIYDYNRYKHRDQWELFDLHEDPTQQANLAANASYSKTFLDLKQQLMQWRRQTEDPWLVCSDGSGVCSGGEYSNSQDGPQIQSLQASVAGKGKGRGKGGGGKGRKRQRREGEGGDGS